MSKAVYQIKNKQTDKVMETVLTDDIGTVKVDFEKGIYNRYLSRIHEKYGTEFYIDILYEGDEYKEVYARTVLPYSNRITYSKEIISNIDFIKIRRIEKVIDYIIELFPEKEFTYLIDYDGHLIAYINREGQTIERYSFTGSGNPKERVIY